MAILAANNKRESGKLFVGHLWTVTVRGSGPLSGDTMDPCCPGRSDCLSVV